MFLRCACRALSSAVVKLPEEPRPVPAGMSAIEVISTYGPSTPTRRIASRMIGWRSSLACFTRSSWEYLTIRSVTNVWWSVM